MTRKSTIHLLITLIAAVLYVPFLGAFHLFDWDEINFAEAAREMIVSGNWGQVQIGFEPFWEKPTLFIWLQALSMKLFGINEFAARFPNAICGIISLNIFYHYGRKVLNHFAGLFWVLAYAGSLAPSLYFQSGIIDPVFNLFIFLSIHQLFLAETAKHENELPRIHYLQAGLFCGLAILAKGPVALLIITLVGMLRIFRNPKYAWPGILNLLLFFFSAFLIASIWILPEWISHGPKILQEFIHYQMVLFQGQIEWHNQPWFYHVIVLLLLCFPASALALPHLFRNTSFSGPEKLYSAYMRTTFWVVLILFSIVTTKIIHYSSLCWIPLGWFAGITMYRRHTNRGNIPGWVFIPVILVSFLLGAVTTLFPLLFTKNEWLQKPLSMIKDPTVMQILGKDPGWIGFEWVIGILFFIAVIIWIFKYRTTPKFNANWLFIITLIFGILLHVLIIPKAENALQGDYIRSIQENKNADVHLENWSFKTYAIYFYGERNPEDLRGPWDKNQSKYTASPTPGKDARCIFLMDEVVEKPVFIYTRSNFKPDTYFTDKFIEKSKLGGYILWTRKDITKPDIRLIP